MDSVQNARATNGHATDDHGLDDAGAIASDHRSNHASDQSSDLVIPDRYKLVLFNNEVLRLDSVSGVVWILDYERDPTSHQAIRPHWAIIEPATPLQTTHEA